MADEMIPTPGLVLFQPRDGGEGVRVRIEGETVWLSQRLMADLYQVSVKTVNEHLINLYNEEELGREATVRSFRIVQTEGNREVSRSIDHYSLDAIITVGYRIRSTRGTQFRQWATGTLAEYLVKGFAMDDERLKAGRSLGRDYFDERRSGMAKLFVPRPNRSFWLHSSIFLLDRILKCRYPVLTTPAMPLPKGTHTLAGFSLRWNRLGVRA